MTKPLTELFDEKVAYARETLLEAEKIAYRKNSRDYAEACFQFGGDPELRDPWFHGVGFDAGSEKESNRRKRIDLATKKLIEALEKIETGWMHYGDVRDLANQALAGFRASLEDVK